MTTVLIQPTSASIQNVADQIVAKFHPLKIILFGSYGYGQPTADSDVDLLVLVDRDSVTVRDAAAISRAIAHPFPLDILVQSNSKWEEYLQEGAIFATLVSKEGQVLYEAGNSRLGG